MRSAAVVALIAASAVGGGTAVAYQAGRPDPQRVQVDVISPAAQTTPAATATVKPTSTPTTAKTVQAPAVSSKTTTARKRVTVQRQEATVSEPTQPTSSTTGQEPLGSNAPRKGPNDGAPGTPAATGVFGGTQRPTATN